MAEIILWAAVLGLLIGVIWSLKYIVVIDQRLEKMEAHMERILSHIAKSRK